MTFFWRSMCANGTLRFAVCVASRSASTCAPPATMNWRSAFGEALIFAGIAIEQCERDKINEADDSRRRETPAPAVMQQQKADQRHADRGAELGGGVEECGGEAAFAARKPVADGFRAAGKRGSFTDAEQQARGEETSDSECAGGTEAGGAPEESADAADLAHTESVEQETGRDLHERIASNCKR